MGIPGLLGYVCHPENGCIEDVDLVQIAREKNGIEILVDYNNFLGNIYQKFVENLCAKSGNENIILSGGEYAAFHRHICQLINKLKSVDIMLRFYIDGAKGSCTGRTERKLETWKQRHISRVKTLNSVIDFCHYKTSLDTLTGSASVCIEIQLFYSVLSCGLEIVQVPSGEADDAIAKDLHQREKAYAVMSSDSDFCIFKNCRFLPMTQYLLDLLQLLPDARPCEIICGMVENKKVVLSLGLSSEIDLVEMAILVGNDYTSPFVGRLKIKDCAENIRRYGQVESVPEVQDILKKQPAFKEAIKYSRDFYLLRITTKPPTDPKTFTGRIEKNIVELNYPPAILGMHRKLYWRRVVVEDVKEINACAEIAVETIRAIVYYMISPEHRQLVTEYGRTRYVQLVRYQVPPLDDKLIPKIDKINPNETEENLRLFHYIMTHLEKEEIKTIWTDKYGKTDGFKYLLLRYFLLLNWEKRLHVTKDEFLSLVAMVFGGYDKEDDYQRVPIRPSPRCVTIGAWIQVIYRTMFLFLSKILFLSSGFPNPHELFSGSVWTVFYVLSNKIEQRKVHKGHQMFLNEARNYKNSIINNKQELVKDLTEGCFSVSNLKG